MIFFIFDARIYKFIEYETNREFGWLRSDLMAIIFEVASFWWPLSIALKLLAFGANDYFARSAFCGLCSERSRVNHSFRDKSETLFSMPRCHYELRLCRIACFSSKRSACLRFAHPVVAWQSIEIIFLIF